MNFRSNTIRFLVVASAAAGAALVTTAPAMAASPTTTASSPATSTRPSLGRLGPLTDLVVQRLLISDQVAASKFGTTSPIDDPAREQQELDEVRQQATTLGLDPTATAAFFQDQINASKVIQRGDFAKWTAHPDQAPTSKPDLTQIRTELDELTTKLLAELKTTQQLRGAPLACTIQLEIATGTGKLLDRLDALHRNALDVATQSVCR